MESLYFWVPMVLILSAGAVAVYIWAVNDGQYDDLDRQALQLLFDDEPSALPNVTLVNAPCNKQDDHHQHE